MQLIPYYRAAWKAKAFQLCSLFYAYLRINLLGQSNKVEVFSLGNSKFMAAYIYINIYVCVYTKKRERVLTWLLENSEAVILTCLSNLENFLGF